MMWTKQWWTLGAFVGLLWACDGDQYHHHHYNPGSPIVGSGQLATEWRTVESFTAVEVSAAGHLIVEQTGVESLQVTAEDNILPLVRTEVRDGRLILGFEPHVGLTLTREVLFRLTVRELDDVGASGASRVEMPNVSGPELALHLSGASFLSASGRVDRTRLDLSGASRCDAPDLRSRTLKADVSGASHAFVRVWDSLVVNASGASILEYLGDPTVSASVSGGSIVRRAGE